MVISTGQANKTLSVKLMFSSPLNYHDDSYVRELRELSLPFPSYLRQREGTIKHSHLFQGFTMPETTMNAVGNNAAGSQLTSCCRQYSPSKRRCTTYVAVSPVHVLARHYVLGDMGALDLGLGSKEDMAATN